MTTSHTPGPMYLEPGSMGSLEGVSHFADLQKFCAANGLRFHSEAFGKNGVCVDVWSGDQKIGYRKSYKAALNMARAAIAKATGSAA